MSLTKYSFSGLLAKEKKIRIPKIQRDYAQGRRNKKVDEIRKIFVHTLLLVVKGKRPETELDFVYGSNVNDAFEPLDGQQRLTTLFLLHWMLGIDLSTDESTKHSVFTYETRNTSREFCDELVQHEAIIFVHEARQNKAYNEAQLEAKKKDNTIKVNLKPTVPSKLIAGRDWFKWEWKYDPTILSMLVMIDAIFEEMGDDWDLLDLSVCRANLEHISFNELNLGEFGLSNELFIKMNARGKQLSDFDKMKSTLEEELQLQQKETDEQGVPLATQEDEERWRTLVDGAWIDLFWHKYASEVFGRTEQYTDRKKRNDERLRAAKNCELQFKKLLLRLIAIQILEDNRCTWELCGHAYNMDECSIDNLLFEYSDSLTDLRSDENHVVVPADRFVFNFKKLMDDVNLLIYKDIKGKYHEISDVLSKSSRINPDPDSWTIFDYLLGREIAKDVIPVCYSMLLFLRAFPAPKDKLNDQELFAWHVDTNTCEPWRKNLEVWVKMSRNILLNVNNNIRIDKIDFLWDAMQSLRSLTDDLVDFVASKNAEDASVSIATDATLVYQFLASSTKTYIRLDNQSLKEEREKASRIVSDVKWETEYAQAEQYPYLWGQIRCLDNWGNGNIDDFVDYRDKLIALLDYVNDNSHSYYAALLAFDPSCWEENCRLFVLNKERDNSIKRQLRDSDSGVYGITIKKMLDLWRDMDGTLPVSVFIDKVIDDRKGTAPTWVQSIIENKDIIGEAWNKRVFTDAGHPILAQRKTDDSHCMDPIFVYLRNWYDNNCPEGVKYIFNDSKGAPAHTFIVVKDEKEYTAKWSAANGMYAVEADQNPVLSDCDAANVIQYMKELINK